MTALRQRMTEDMQVRNLSPHTQASYLQQVSLFARYFRTSPDALTPEHIRTYQIYLTNEKKLATNSIHTAVAALRFLYRVTLKKDWDFGEEIPLPKKPQKLPVVLSPEEVVHFLNCVACRKHRVILTTCYAAGLRISEAVRLKITAIDSARMIVRIEQGKGRKGRYVMLSPVLLEILRRYWRAARSKEWLFPGLRDDWPITKDAVEAACQKAHRLSGLSKRAWLKPENRCLVPANSFAEYAPEPNPDTGKKDVVWFALNDERPLFAFAGIWTEFKGDRGTSYWPMSTPSSTPAQWRSRNPLQRAHRKLRTLKQPGRRSRSSQKDRGLSPSRCRR